jgi:SAM-dependent methyltransferase
MFSRFFDPLYMVCREGETDPTEIIPLNSNDSLESSLTTRNYSLYGSEGVASAFYDKYGIDPSQKGAFPDGSYIQLSHPKCFLTKNQKSFFCVGHRTRSLGFLNYLIRDTGLRLEDFIQKNLNEDSSISVLELGIGQGRALLELKNIFPFVNFTGVNKTQGEFGVTNRDSLRETNLFFEINLNWEDHFFQQINLDFFDLSPGRLSHYDNESFNLIYSFAMFRYIENAHLLLEDIWRKLKVGGTAVVEISSLVFLDEFDNVINGVKVFRSVDGFKFFPAINVLIITKEDLRPIDLKLTPVRLSSEDSKDPGSWEWKNYFRWHG